MKRLLIGGAATLVAVSGVTAGIVGQASAHDKPPKSDTVKTATPIKHLVVLFDENVSFDHYFGTYPNATNPSGEPAFHARPGTPTVNGLSGALLTDNPNGFDLPTGFRTPDLARCRVRRGVLDAGSKATGVPSSSGRAGAAA
jgi:phospholipase C